MVGSSTIRLPVVRTATETDGASQYLCHGRNLGITTLLTWRVLQLPFSNAEVVHSGSRWWSSTQYLTSDLQKPDFFVCNIQTSCSFVLGVKPPQLVRKPMYWATLKLTESSPATDPVSWLTISPYCWITGARLSASIFKCSQKIRVAPARAALYTVIRTSPTVMPLVVSDGNTIKGRSKGSNVMVIDVIELGSNAGCDSQWKNFFPFMW